MNIFQRLLHRQFDAETRLGTPLPDAASRERRMNNMAALTGGRGFRQPKKGPTARRENETHLRSIYLKNLEDERAFRESKKGEPGWGIREIADAIERREHLK